MTFKTVGESPEAMVRTLDTMNARLAAMQQDLEGLAHEFTTIQKGPSQELEDKKLTDKEATQHQVKKILQELKEMRERHEEDVVGRKILERRVKMDSQKINTLEITIPENPRTIRNMQQRIETLTQVLEDSRKAYLQQLSHKKAAQLQIDALNKGLSAAERMLSQERKEKEAKQQQIDTLSQKINRLQNTHAQEKGELGKEPPQSLEVAQKPENASTIFNPYTPSPSRAENWNMFLQRQKLRHILVEKNRNQDN